MWIALVYQTISAFWAQFEHANLKINPVADKFLQLIVVTPNMHKIHHSLLQPETDSNYSNIFSIWDRIFFTFNKRKKYDDINYGLDYLPEAKEFSFTKLLKMPFLKNNP
jgi:sterol desaturase/sphingolipid hydroxylase (fatty acid hydroxylase superfamily)